MVVRKPLGCFVLLLFVHVSWQLTCPKPKGHNCIPIGRPPVSCITQTEDGEGLTWFKMQEKCLADDGRLVWLKDDFTLINLVPTLRLSSSSRTYISIGLLQSMEGDELTFWRTPNDNATFSCGSRNTNTCIPSSTLKQCRQIGCCWVNGECQYPEQQWLTENNRSTDLDTSALAATPTRRCVALQKNGSTWTPKAYDCDTPRGKGTGFVCEYKCVKDWQSSSWSQRNVTWPAGIHTTVTTTANNESSSGSQRNVTWPAGIHTTVTTTTNNGAGRNTARGIFNTQTLRRAVVTSIMALALQALINNSSTC